MERLIAGQLWHSRYTDLEVRIMEVSTVSVPGSEDNTKVTFKTFSGSSELSLEDFLHNYRR